MLDLLSAGDWQMTSGERAALEGILAQLKPELAIEIGTAQGGSLRRIAAHSSQVHSFDLVKPLAEVEQFPRVTLHTGDSHVLLAEFLSELERAGRNVDFALVDGDHTAEGVRRDLEALLSSGAVGRCVIVIHDTANEMVRDGLERVRFQDHAKVKYVDVDFVAGHLSTGGPYHHQLWGGMGLVMVDGAEGSGHAAGPETGFYPSFELFSAIRDGLVAAERQGRLIAPRDVVAVNRGPDAMDVALSAELERARATISSITGSASWRVTAPLRRLKRAIKSGRG